MNRSYKKDFEPLLDFTGAMSSCSREKILFVPEEGTRAPTLKGGLVYSILDEQTGVRKMLITRENAAS
jgi:hypothetical protein